jgi:hypothetical protein
MRRDPGRLGTVLALQRREMLTACVMAGVGPTAQVDATHGATRRGGWSSLTLIRASSAGFIQRRPVTAVENREDN